ncbi:MAG TPA: imidazolonepropionase [Steroidobacteraceae bacterium]|nr:imidazolonepropionase [Steroidobacteraceae bacterium]
MRRIEHGALVTREGRIEWIGPAEALPAALRADLVASHDLAGAWVTPGLVDCHTHLVFAGTRAAEQAERSRGVSYEEIARRGGGILTTVRATRAASEEQLFEESAPRLDALLSEGVTTVEVKSGYGLTLADEAKLLRVARRLGRASPVRVRTTLLAAHAVPPEFAGRADEYIDRIAREWLPELHAQGLIDAVDIFCERIAFDARQAERLFAAARELGLPVKMHAEQLANIGGSLVAARFGALSCDHLEFADEAVARALARAGTVAVLLPVAFYCLGGDRKPPVAGFRAAGTHMAVATDCNPGSAPGTSLLLALNMAVRLFGLTAEEALAGATREAGRALGLGAEVGVLEVGRRADFAIWDVGSVEELSYWVAYNRCRAVVSDGKLAWRRAEQYSRQPH